MEFENNDPNVYVNKIMFQKQVIFSVSTEIKLKNLQYILKGKSIYYDFLTGMHYFFVTENDPGYSRLILEGEKIGLKFNKNENIYWVSFQGETLGNEKMRSMLMGKNLRSVDKGMVFPLVLNKEGRIYYLYQYDASSEPDVSESFYKIQRAYNEFYGSGSFKIERISESENFIELFKYGQVDQNFYEMEVSFPYEGPNLIGILKRATINPEEDEFIVKINGEFYKFMLKDMINNLNIPSEGIFNSVKDLSEKFAFTSYFDGKCENGICRVRWIVEERFLLDVLRALNKIVESGVKFSFSKVKKLEIDYQEEKKNELPFSTLNKEMFQKEIIYSKDMDYMPLIKDIIDKAIIYNDSLSLDLFFVLDNSSQIYPEVKIKAIRNNIKIDENRSFLWLKFPDISKSNKDIFEKISVDRQINLPGSFHLPFHLINNNRIYYCDQYNKDYEYDVTARILNVHDIYHTILGKDSFRIEKVCESEDPIAFIRNLGLESEIGAMQFIFNFEGPDAKGILKNFSSEVNNIQFVVDHGNGLEIVNLTTIVKEIPSIGNIVEDFLKSMNDNLIFFLYFEFECKNGTCKVNIFMEEKMVPLFLSNLDMFADIGFKIILSKFEIIK